MYTCIHMYTHTCTYSYIYIYIYMYIYMQALPDFRATWRCEPTLLQDRMMICTPIRSSSTRGKQNQNRRCGWKVYLWTGLHPPTEDQKQDWGLRRAGRSARAPREPAMRVATASFSASSAASGAREHSGPRAAWRPRWPAGCACWPLQQSVSCFQCEGVSESGSLHKPQARSLLWATESARLHPFPSLGEQCPCDRRETEFMLHIWRSDWAIGWRAACRTRTHLTIFRLVFPVSNEISMAWFLNFQARIQLWKFNFQARIQLWTYLQYLDDVW